MGFWGKLIGTDEALKTGAKAVGEATTGIIAGIDAAWYTKEEQARDVKEILFKLQDQYTPRSMSRRIFAIGFLILFSIFALTALVFACLEQFTIINADPSSTVEATAKAVEHHAHYEAIIAVANALSIGTIMLTIVIFYFGYYGVNGAIKAFGGKNK
jgi:hypothetical protein